MLLILNGSSWEKPNVDVSTILGGYMKKILIISLLTILVVTNLLSQIVYSDSTVSIERIEEEIEKLKYSRFACYIGILFRSDPRNMETDSYYDLWQYLNNLDQGVQERLDEISHSQSRKDLEAEADRIYDLYKSENTEKFSNPYGYNEFKYKSDDELNEEELFLKYTFYPRIEAIYYEHGKNGISMSNGLGTSVLEEVELMISEKGGDKKFAHGYIENLFWVYYFRYCNERLNYLITFCEENKTKGISKRTFENLLKQVDSKRESVIYTFYGGYKLREELLDNILDPEDAERNWEKEVYALLYQRAGNTLTAGGESDTTRNRDSNPFSDSAFPAVGVFVATFLMLGIRGVLGGMQGNASDTEINDEMESDEESEKAGLVLEVQIQDKTLVAGDCNTSVVLFAGIFVRGSGAEGEAPGQDEIRAAMHSIKVVPKGPAAQYVYFEIEDAGEWDEWRRFYLYFTYNLREIEGGSGGLSFPLRVPLVVSAATNVTPVSKNVYLNIEKPEDRFVINPMSIVLTDDAQAHREILAKVLSIDEGVWEYEYRVEEALENGVEKVVFIPKEDKSVSIVITPLKINEGAGNTIINNVIITAFNKASNRRLEAKLTVTIAKEGLVAVSEKPLSLTADGETTTELKITALSTFDGKLSSDYGLLQSIRFEDSIKTQSQLARNAFETAGFEIIDGGWERGNIHDNTLGYYVYKLKTKREIPGQGENFQGELLVTASKDGEEYRLRIPVLLDITSLGVGSKAWEIELERCRKIVGKIPKEHQERFNTFLDQRAQLLGARGLYELRHKIWRIGQTLWEAEGLSGYEDVAKWSGYIENTLNFTNWLGKLATDVLLSQHMGVFKAIAAGELYNVVVSGINAYTDGMGFDEWFDNYFLKKHMVEIIQSLGAEGIEKSAEKLIEKNPRWATLAVLAYFSYFFITNMKLKKMGVMEAAKAAALNVGIATAVKFLSVRLKIESKAKGNEDTAVAKSKVNTDVDLPEAKVKTNNTLDFHDNLDYEKGFLSAKQKINSLVDAIDSEDKEAITKTIMDIKTDKYSIAEINKVIDNKPLYPDNIKNVINDVFENEIKKPTKKIMDEKVLDFFRKKGYKDAELVFESKSNKSNIVKVGSDWDVSYKVKYVDKDGYIRAKSMKAKDLKPIMEDSLYQTAGEKYGKGLGKHELAEDILDISAMGSDTVGGYGIDVDSALNMEDTAKEFSRMNKDNVINAIENIKSKTDTSGIVKDKQLTVYERKVKKMLDKIKLEDPSSIGLGSGFKEFEWFNRSGADNIEIQGNMLEGMKQLSKQYNKILTPMKSIADTVSNHNSTKIPSVLSDAVDLFNRGKSPEYIDSLLKKNGSSLREVADVLKSQIEGYGQIIKNKGF